MSKRIFTQSLCVEGYVEKSTMSVPHISKPIAATLDEYGLAQYNTRNVRIHFLMTLAEKHQQWTDVEFYVVRNDGYLPEGADIHVGSVAINNDLVHIFCEVY